MLLDITDLLGKPYKAHARGPNTYDCYGLVIEVEKRLGHTMPDLYTKLADCDQWEFDPHNVDFSAEMTGMEKTDKPEFGDVIVFFDLKGRIYHTAVFLKDGDFIHCNRDCVHISNLKHNEKKYEVYTWK